MLGGFGNILGGSMKANSVGNAIDAKVDTARTAAKMVLRELESFDDIENDLKNFANQLQQEAPQLAYIFSNVVNQINRKQTSIKDGVSDMVQKLNEIDGLTDKIQL